MKARVQKMSDQLKETVVLYCVDAEKAEKVKRALSTYTVNVITAGVEDSGQKFGTLFGIPEFPRDEEAAPVPEAEHEAVFFGGFDKSRLNLMMGRMKAAGVTIRFKAMMTTHNQTWTVAYLIGQLAREHATFSKLSQLDTLSRQLMRYNPRFMSEQARKEGAEALAKARVILNRPHGMPPEIVEMTIAALQRSLAAAMAATAAANNAARAANAAASAPAEEAAAETEAEATTEE